MLNRRLDRVNTLHRLERKHPKLAASGREGMVITGDEWNANPWALQAQELVIDLRSGEARPRPIRSEMIMDARQNGSNGPNPELLDLQGKRIVWASETREGQKLNSEKVKLFTGGDTLSARLNYSNEIISFIPTYTLFMLTNNKPRIAAGETAIWDRLRLIPFPIQQFVNEMCLTGPSYRAQAKPLHDAFCKWFAETYGTKAMPPSLKRFSERLRPKFKREEGRNVWFCGLALAASDSFPYDE